MANVFAPYGLLPMEGPYGSPATYELTQGNILYSNTTAIFRGDLVTIGADGYLVQAAGTTIAQVRGVFWGVEYLSTAQGKMVSNSFWPGNDVASTAQSTIVAKIIPLALGSPLKFRIQSDTTGVAFADIGLNAAFTPGAGNTLTGQSGGYLSGLSTTATLPLKVIGLYGGLPGAGGRRGVQPGTTGPYSGSATGANAWAIVTINPTTVGDGI